MCVRYYFVSRLLKQILDNHVRLEELFACDPFGQQWKGHLGTCQNDIKEFASSCFFVLSQQTGHSLLVFLFIP